MVEDSRYSAEENVLLYNKPDKGGIIPLGIALGILLLFFVPFSTIVLEAGPVEFFDEFLLRLIFLGLPGYLTFILIYSIIWELMGEEKISYTETHIRIRQKVTFAKEYVIPLNSIMEIVPYDEPLIYAALPTRDPCVRLSYKTGNNKIRKVYFGYHLNEKQQKNMVESILDLLVESVV